MTKALAAAKLWLLASVDSMMGKEAVVDAPGAVSSAAVRLVTGTVR